MTPLLIEFIEKCAAEQADPERVLQLLQDHPAMMNEYQHCLAPLLKNAIHTLAGPVYVMPILNPDVCDELVRRAQGYPFVPEYSEAREYQINEAILRDVDLEMHDYLLAGLSSVVNAYSLLLYSRPVKSISTVQLAKYSPDGTPGTGYHHDVTSDVSVVISLNPGDFEGGGTGIRLSPDTVLPVAPLPKGYALLFNGKMIQHRGLEVTAGERYLLVLWLSLEEAECESPTLNS